MGDRWHRIPARRPAIWRALVELLHRQVMGAAEYGPPPPITAFRYVQEGPARSGPRRGTVDDQWLCWWELPQDDDGYLIGDCEDLSSAWMARAVLVDKVPVVPVLERVPAAGFHALAGVIDSSAGELPDAYYAGPTRSGVIVVDPSYERGMRDPRRQPACAHGAASEGLCH